MDVISASFPITILRHKALSRTFLQSFLSYFLLTAPLWAQDKEAFNPAAALPQVPIAAPVRQPKPQLQNPATGLPGVPIANPFELFDFSGGLNLKSPPAQLEPNEALVCQNWVFDRNGGLLVRPGFAKINSSVLSAVPIWGLYHYSVPTFGKGFLVGDSLYIHKMTDAGTFADDSEIYVDEIRGDFVSGSDSVNIDFPSGFFNLERKIAPGDKISYGGGATKYTLKQFYYDTVTALYKMKLTAAAGATSANQAFRVEAASTVVPTNGSFVQRNNTVFFALGNRPNGRWNGKLGDIVGVYANGKIDTVYYATTGAFKSDTMIVCNSCNFSTDELAGKILRINAFYRFHGNDSSGTNINHRIVRRNTAKRITYYDVTLDSSLFVRRGQPFTVWSPVFTVVDSGKIDSIYQINADYVQMNSFGKSFNDQFKYAGKVIEFLDGQARGILDVTGSGPIDPLSTALFFYKPNFDSSSYPKKGDRYAIYSLGAQAGIQELYYNRLVLAGIPNFVNTIRYTEADNLNDFPGTNFLTLPEQGGDSIVAIVNTGNLTVFQRQRIWTLIGPPPWTGQTVILSSDGVGCIAPNSIVKDGNYVYFVGLRGNIPTVFRRDVNDISRFTTASGGSVFEGQGPLLPLTVKIDPLMSRVNKSKLSKISAGLVGEHLVISLPFGSSSNSDSTIIINTRTGAIGQWTLAGGIWHNGRAAGDSGQVYFTSPNDSGWVYLFGGATDSFDLGQSFTTIYQGGWQDFGAPTLTKQGIRLWAQYFRSNTSGSSIWKIRTDFTTTDQNTFTTTTTTGERDENSYVSPTALGKRFGFRFEGSGVRSSFRLNGLIFKFALRGEGL